SGSVSVVLSWDDLGTRNTDLLSEVSTAVSAHLVEVTIFGRQRSSDVSGNGFCGVVGEIGVITAEPNDELLVLLGSRRGIEYLGNWRIVSGSDCDGCDGRSRFEV